MAENEQGQTEGNAGNVGRNMWVVSTAILAVVLVGVLFFRGGGGITGNVVSEKTAGDNLISFINAQGTDKGELVSIERSGELYQAVVKYKGENIPVYVSLDGKYLISNVVPLSEDAAAAAGAQAQTQTNTQQTPTEVPKSDKPKVEVFVMAYCPYGTQIEKGIIPVAQLLKDKIDFSIKFVYYAMHGQKELDENTRQSCIQKEQTSKFFDYMTCFLSAGDSASCLTSTGIDSAKLSTCVDATDKQFNITANFEDKSSWLSGQYPRYDVNKAENEKYSIGGSPTLVINGAEASSGRDSASLLKAVCAAFTTAPAECSQTLSSASPSPGFGGGTQAAATNSGSAGGCASA